MQLQNPTSLGFWLSPASILLLLLLIFAMNLSVSNASAANRFQNETDRLALLEFKRQVNDPYGVLTSWNRSQHHCQWLGIKCSIRHQRVTALILRGKSLSGILSPHVGNLSFVNSIDLAENQLHGDIPQEIGRLLRLRILGMTNNTLTGEIPVNLSHCLELKYLELGMNKLEGKIPSELGSLKKLEGLYLAVNKLTGKIPSSIGNLSSMTELSLTINSLEGNLPKEMGFLTSLTKLGVSVNKLSGEVPASIFNISALVIISLSVNLFHGSPPTSIGFTLPNLQQLLIGGNVFYGNLPISITNASTIEILDLADNKFEGQVPTNLGNLFRLRRLNLAGNLLGSNSAGDLSFVASLTNCSNLTTVLMEDNNIGGEIPEVMTNLSNQLTKLRLRGNQLLGNIPTGFGNFVNLYVLDVSFNFLSGYIPSDFGKFQNLQGLNLRQNRLSGEILSTLCNISSLSLLDLSNNLFEGINIFDNVLKNCQNLQKLDISQNNLSGVISPQFFDMNPSLVYMNLQHNTFSGSLPLEVGKLIHLVTFNVSYNKFTGVMPLSLVDCLNLEYINMQGNFFQGIIPPKLASLKGIQELDLSSNNLTGQVPKDLEKLHFLRYLNLSYNDLEGVIPNTGIFANASQVILNGNRKLCGGIPELGLPSCLVIKGKHKRKIKVTIVLLSTVFPVMVLVVGTLLVYFVAYKKGYRRKIAFSTAPDQRFDKLLRVSYHELHRATSGFSPESLIGSGSFGVVYKGRLDQHGSRVVAIKVLDLQKNGASKSFKAECKALRNIRHRNLVSILSYCSSIDSRGHEFKALIYEFMENGNLDFWLHQETDDDATTLSRNVNLLQRLNIAIDVASALHYLHNHCQSVIVHCDLKPSNILLDNELVAHVADFGLSRLLPNSKNNSSPQGTTSSSIAIKGTIGYTPPEYGIGHQASTSGDIYSYGILLLEMFTGKRPTDDMFMDGLDLHNYVVINMALPEQVFNVVDQKLLSRKVVPGLETDHDEKKLECLTAAILQIGVKCSATLPNDRMHIDQVVKELHLIRDVFLGT